MNTPDFIDVTFQAKDGSHNVDTVRLEVEEYQPIDPAAYQLEAGWSCFSPISNTEYFISLDGIVWRQPENVVVGFAPVLREAAKCEDDGHWIGG
jgi:hypothetical protein